MAIDSESEAKLPDKIDWPLPMEARNYDEFIIKLLNVQKTRPADLESEISQCEAILSVPSQIEQSGQTYLHSISCNLVEIIKSLIRWDRTSSLKPIYQKISSEMSKVPFELHLALSLNLELVRPSAGSMFYFPYLDELLAFIENTSLFLSYFRLFSALRVSLGEVSQLDSLTTYKITSKFGEAEDLTFLMDSFKMPSADLLKQPSPGIKWQAELQVTVIAYHTEQLAFNFSALERLWPLLDAGRLETKMAGQSTKQFRCLPLVDASD
jgi:hypothetical protein